MSAHLREGWHRLATDFYDRGLTYQDRLGQCFEMAARYVIDHPVTELIHGSIQGYGAPRLDHAWVDTGSGIFDAVMGKHFTYDEWELFANPIEGDRFSYRTLSKLISKHKHWGPW